MPPALSHEILTPRLALISITPAALRSEQSSDGQLTHIIHAELPPDWPPAEWEPHVFTILLAQFERFPDQPNLHRYVALLQPDGTRILIGCVGAFRHEGRPDECEIGYSILSPYEGRGLATEAAQALITLIRRTPGVTSIIAHTFPHLTASIRIMQNCGLTPDGAGAEPGTIRYRLTLEETIDTDPSP